MNIVDACDELLDVEYHCAQAVASSLVKTPVINLENAIIDAASSGLSECSICILTFKVDERCCKLDHFCMCCISSVDVVNLHDACINRKTVCLVLPCLLG